MQFGNLRIIALSMHLLLILIAQVSSAQVLDPARRITWDPGVRGGIPTTYGTDCTASPLPATSTAGQIQSALNTCASAQAAVCNSTNGCPIRALKLAAGTFNVSSSIKIPSYVVLRGAGIGQTELLGTSGFSGSSMIVFSNGFDTGWGAGNKALGTTTNPLNKGDTTVYLNADPGWTAGDIVLIDQAVSTTSDPVFSHVAGEGTCTWCGRSGRNNGQWVRITSKAANGLSVAIDPPLYWSYSNSPQGVEMTGLTHYAGVEDLTVNNLRSNARDTVAIEGAINSWLLRVELIGSKRRAVWGYGALWFTFQSCKIWGGVPVPAVVDSNTGKYRYVGIDYDIESNLSDGNYTSDNAYGIFLGPHFTASLITDNILEKLTMAVAYEGAVAGNVTSYNYMGQMWWKSTGGDYPHRFGPLMHGGHPMMNLLEGNYSIERFRADNAWGSSSHFTLLRNKFALRNRGTACAQAWTVDLERQNRYYNFLGNILGTVGKETEYEVHKENNPYSCTSASGSKAIFRLGYDYGDENPNNAEYDTEVRCTLFRCKNWVSKQYNPDSAGNVDTNPYYVAARASDSGLEQIDPGIVCKDKPGRDIVNTCAANAAIPDSYYLSSRPSWFKNPANSQDLRWPPMQSESSNPECPIPALLRYDPTFTIPSGCLAGSGPSAPSNLRLQ
jgi:hypothetical protein